MKNYFKILTIALALGSFAQVHADVTPVNHEQITSVSALSDLGSVSDCIVFELKACTDFREEVLISDNGADFSEVEAFVNVALAVQSNECLSFTIFSGFDSFSHRKRTQAKEAKMILPNYSFTPSNQVCSNIFLLHPQSWPATFNYDLRNSRHAKSNRIPERLNC